LDAISTVGEGPSLYSSYLLQVLRSWVQFLPSAQFLSSAHLSETHRFGSICLSDSCLFIRESIVFSGPNSALDLGFKSVAIVSPSAYPLRRELSALSCYKVQVNMSHWPFRTTTLWLFQFPRDMFTALAHRIVPTLHISMLTFPYPFQIEPTQIDIHRIVLISPLSSHQIKPYLDRHWQWPFMYPRQTKPIYLH
jgi:hypothetical protein